MLKLRLTLRRTAVTILLGAALATGGSLGAAFAKEVPYQTPEGLKGKCDAAGGTYYPPGESGVHMCTGKSGNIVACGGVGKYKNRCDSYDAARTGAARVRLIQLRSLAATGMAATLE